MRKLANEELERKSIEEFKKSEKLPVVIFLDNIRSLNNVGSAFRTADAFLVEKIYLGGITGTPPHRDITKTALGATESVEWEHMPDTMAGIKKLKEDGYKIVSVEQVDKSVMLSNFQPIAGEKYCLVFGNEVFGVDEKIVEVSDKCIEIPQHGTKHSLNISVSVGIVIWDFYNKLGNK
ncbi:RNA methyltransferase [Fulvivirga kasyanovii]|uniref:TrmH family RNA methyltransferase n=1 Tax=Fulvivirga kasyanovii TaxID=396812 RepID=A0ABW9RL43_9BACT|nr:RNA methyltransferase [Fulvivirga kasyanovii]MTI24818.1 TrmH family RNA methyltransferase [Fulvivirga kasyanovii]